MQKKILFVCLGNICRSPLAEGILFQRLKDEKLNWLVDSAGTSNYHVGQKPDPRTIANALAHGVDLNTLRARAFVKKDFEDFDFIFTLDNSITSNVLSMTSSTNDKKKVHLFLEWIDCLKEQEVPDPYYGTESDFEKVYQLVDNACEKLILKLKTI
jgi:protein-tyrosine phosphatase